ncbi:hypothetical protein [Nisaea sp.]
MQLRWSPRAARGGEWAGPERQRQELLAADRGLRRFRRRRQCRHRCGRQH